MVQIYRAHYNGTDRWELGLRVAVMGEVGPAAAWRPLMSSEGTHTPLYTQGHTHRERGPKVSRVRTHLWALGERNEKSP